MKLKSVFKVIDEDLRPKQGLKKDQWPAEVEDPFTGEMKPLNGGSSKTEESSPKQEEQVNDSKIADVAREDQTDKMKMDIYKYIRQFVNANQEHYYPHFKGDRDDLVQDIFVNFLTPKLRRNGNPEKLTELDIFDPDKSGDYEGDKLASWIKRYVVSKLIDMERTDKKEVNVQENYDDEGSSPTIDRLAKLLEAAQSGDFNPDEFEITPEFIGKARDAFDELDFDQQQAFKDVYEKEKEDINPKFQELFDDLLSGIKTISGDALKDAVAKVGGGGEISEQNIKTFPTPVIRILFDTKDKAIALSKNIPEGYKLVRVYNKGVYLTKE